MSVDAVRLTKVYQYPAHAVRVFDRVVHEQAQLGLSLQSVSKGYFLGTGVSFKFEFVPSDELNDYRLTYRLGRSKDLSDKDLEGWAVMSRLPMKAYWIRIGTFFVLSRPRHAA